MNESPEVLAIESAVQGGRNPNNWYCSAESLRRAALSLRVAIQESNDELRRVVELMRQLPDHDEIERRLDPGTNTAYITAGEARVYEVLAESSRNRPASVTGVAMMLEGLALENLAKGVIVANAPARIQPNSGRPRDLTNWGHIDSPMLRDAGVTLSETQHEVVKRLRQFVEWGGRYPIAKDALKMEGGITWNSSDFEVIDALYDQLSTELWRHCLEHCRGPDAPADMAAKE